MKEKHNSYRSGEEDNILMSSHSPNKILNNTFSDSNEVLKNIKLSNINRIVVAHLNINSLRNKFELLKLFVMNNIDILLITESNLDSSFPSQQFAIEGYSLPLRLDRNSEGGGLIIYVREGIPCRQIKNLPCQAISRVYS